VFKLFIVLFPLAWISEPLEHEPINLPLEDAAVDVGHKVLVEVDHN
jgi:hypothetical protein